MTSLPSTPFLAKARRFASKIASICLLLSLLWLAFYLRSTQGGFDSQEQSESAPVGQNPVDSEAFCYDSQTLALQTVKRPLFQVKNRIKALSNYASKQQISLPQLRLEQTEWGGQEGILRKEAESLAQKYCQEKSTDPLSDFLVGGKALRASIAEQGGKTLSLPLLHLNCNLISTKGADVLGLYLPGKKPVILIEALKNESNPAKVQKNLEFLAHHEISHFWDENRWNVDAQDRQKQLRADEIFSTPERSMLGLSGCQMLDYYMLSEMAADGRQMAEGTLGQIKQEWWSGQHQRDTLYRAKFHLLSHLLFNHLAHENELGTRVNQIFGQRELGPEEIREVGHFMYIMAQKGMSKVGGK